MNCSICERLIDGPYLTEVTGWVVSRKAGGANAIRAKKETGNVAHVTCVDRRAAGLEPISGQIEIPCPVKFEFGDIACKRPAGHPGPHSGPYVGLWFNDRGKRVEGGSAEDIGY